MGTQKINNRKVHWLCTVHSFSIFLLFLSYCFFFFYLQYKRGMVHLMIFRNGIIFPCTYSVVWLTVWSIFRIGCIYFRPHTLWLVSLGRDYSVVWFTVRSIFRIGKIFPCTYSVAWFTVWVIFRIFIILCFWSWMVHRMKSLASVGLAQACPSYAA